MNNQIILRFYVVATKQMFEVFFDTRLSFNENFDLLSKIYDYKLNRNNYIVDDDRRALARDVPLKLFHFKLFTTLCIY